MTVTERVAKHRSKLRAEQCGRLEVWIGAWIVEGIRQLAKTWKVSTLPAFILLAMLTAMGLSLFLSAISVRYRDVGHTVQFWHKYGCLCRRLYTPSV